MGEEKEWDTDVMSHCGTGFCEALFCCVGYSRAETIAEGLGVNSRYARPTPATITAA